MKPIMPLAAIVAVAAAPATAVTTTLDFNAAEACVAACVNGSQIRQTYGDTADLDISYLSRDDFGNATVFVSTMFWWNTGFGDLQGVAFVSRTPEIRFELQGLGKVITLASFDMARFTGTATTEIRIYDLGWNLLWSATDLLAPIGGRLSFEPGVSSTTGLIMQHGPDANNRGIDNIVFTLSDAMAPGVIPEPATWAMLIAGFGLVGQALRPRRRAMIATP